MAQPHIQTLLRTGWTPEKLLTKYGIDFHRGVVHPNLVSFTHTRSAPLASPAVQECCGLLLDEAQNWLTIARPFDVFSGYGTTLAAALDWSTVRIEEFLDGTLCVLYFYNEGWHIATKNSPDASVRVGLHGRTVREIFWEVWHEEKFELPKPRMSHLTFLFELTGPENRNIVQHTRPHLTLVGIRHRMGMELKPEFQSWYPFTVSLRIKTLLDIGKALDTRRGIDCKGFIAIDRYFHRAKFFHPQYRALKAGKVRWNLRQWVDLLREYQEGDDDVSKYFPEDRRLVVTLTEAITRLANEIDAAYWLVKDLQPQKVFAAHVRDLPYASVLFSLRKGYTKDAREALQRMPVDRLLRLAQLKKESFYAIRGEDDDTVAVVRPELSDNDTSVNDSLEG